MKTEKKPSQALLSFVLALIVAAFALLMFSACKKKTTAPEEAKIQQPTNSICLNSDTSFLNKLWIPCDSIHADIKFNSDYSFYQNGTSFATWSKFGCDSLKFVRPSGSSFYYRILYLSIDTLKLNNPLYGPLKYHR